MEVDRFAVAVPTAGRVLDKQALIGSTVRGTRALQDGGVVKRVLAKQGVYIFTLLSAAIKRTDLGDSID